MRATKLEHLKTRSLAALSVAVLVIVGLLGIPSHAHASGGQFYLSPASQSVTAGSDFTVSLRLNPGMPVDSLDVSVTYDSSKLMLDNGVPSPVDCSGSPFSAISCGASASPIHIVSLINGGSTSSDSLVTTMTFRALQSSGRSSLSISGQDAYQGAVYTPATAGAIIQFAAAPVSVPTPTPTPTPVSGTSGSTSSGGTSSNSSNNKSSTKTTTTPPVQSATPSTPVATSVPGLAITGSKVQYTAANFSLTSTAPTQAYLIYGMSPDGLTSQTALSDFSTSHQLSLDPGSVTPGQRYYYAIVTKDSAGTIQQTKVQSFTTKGLAIRIGVFDKNHKPLTKKQLTLHSTPRQGITDGKGYVSFYNVAAGTHHLLYQVGKKTYSATLSTANNVTTIGGVQSAPLQQLSAVYPLKQSNPAAVILPLISVLLIVVLAIAVYLLRNRLSALLPKRAPAEALPPIVVEAPAAAIGPANSPLPDQPATPAATNADSEQVLAHIPNPIIPDPGSVIASTPPDTSDNERSEDHHAF